MGHTRLGKIPTSRKWNAVVASVTEFGASDYDYDQQLTEAVEKIASTTLDAAEAGLQKASRDPGVQFSFFLLTQLALSTKDSAARETLLRHGIDTTKVTSAVELSAQIQHAVDMHLSNKRWRSDFSAMARQSMSSTLSEAFSTQQLSLFQKDNARLQESLRHISTPKQFGELGQRFFGNFMSRFLNFYLSRITASNVQANGLGSTGAISGFNEALEIHCRQSALVVNNFCGEWYSKTQYVEGINEKNSSGFVHHAFTKLEAELKRQRGDQ